MLQSEGSRQRTRVRRTANTALQCRQFLPLLLHLLLLSVVNPACAQALECATSLERLDISATSFTEKSAAVLAAALSKLQRLQRLWAGHNAWGLQGVMELMSHLTELPHLRMLDLSHSGLHHGGRADSWAQLVPCLKRFCGLCHLNVFGNGHQSDQAAALLAAAMGTCCEYVRV